MNFKHSYLVLSLGAVLATPSAFTQDDIIDILNDDEHTVAFALVHDSQENYGTVYAYPDERDGSILNSASLSGNEITDFSGIAGFNAAAGNLNEQDNSAAISALGDEDSIAAAAVLVEQIGRAYAETYDANNKAKVNQNSLEDSEGILGVNVAAGNINMQKNNAAIAYSASDADLAVAVVATAQVAGSFVSTYNENNCASIDDNVLSNVSGIVGINTVAGNGNIQSNNVAIAASGF